MKIQFLQWLIPIAVKSRANVDSECRVRKTGNVKINILSKSEKRRRCTIAAPNSCQVWVLAVQANRADKQHGTNETCMLNICQSDLGNLDLMTRLLQIMLSWGIY
jgi:hypothetical protein